MTDQEAADSSVVVDLELWFDLVDPWSWFAKRRVEMAIAAFERPADVALRLRSFEVAPEQVAVLPASARQVAGHELVGDDYEIPWDRAGWVSTFDAHRLCELARELGGPALQSAAVERFFFAHFVEGHAIDDLEVLQRAGAECGLDERRVAAVLAGTAYGDEVRRDEEMARALDVVVVPFLVANGSATLPGVHPTEDYLAFLREVATTQV
ncbi:DSBA oxidoreductase [Intrasporangium oryzae NRRL B-24470]|uniref:DSBA oxidoreductase n=1 Tax=Intrasporangium oryzae NRRL B-24470 TaxID=1386089 RepID=W9G9Y6_9MICO|nr:DsbA family protein [Intrasporangium oryzae]EWT00684.1 DSBA oxidoreductase [Intrasporangium oryzae NRRL B-24470]